MRTGCVLVRIAVASRYLLRPGDLVEFDEKTAVFSYHRVMSVQLTVEDLNTAVHAALNAWNQIDGTPLNRLEQLLLVQEHRTAMAEDLPVTLRLATNDVLHTCLEELALHDQTSAHILTWRYLDGETVQAVANRVHLGRDQFMRRQRRAISALTQIIVDKELATRDARAREIEALLVPPSYDRLFGIDDALQKLAALLLSPEPPWVVTLTGIGGIGKSSLANAGVRQVIRHFYYDRIIWLSLDPQPAEDQNPPVHPLSYADLMVQLAPLISSNIGSQTPPPQRDLALQQLLKSFPHLIVIDNLEVATDSHLLTHLHHLANPSKFLLTSRARPFSQVGAFNFPVRELPAADAIGLIRNQAHTIGQRQLAQAADALLVPIYDHVGGNPLAIKLIVGLTHDLSLPQIIEELTQVHLQEVEQLYRHIYWKVWQSLSQEAKVLLEVMPLSSDTGIVQAQMQAVSGLAERQLVNAIQELSQRSLLEVRGTPSERRYTIHSLTRTFLHSEIIHWPQDKSR